MSDDKIQGSESGADPAPVHREVITPGPWRQYAKTVFAGNTRGFDVTADGNYIVVACDMTEADSRAIEMVPEMIRLLEDSLFSFGGNWKQRRDEILSRINGQ